MVPVVGVDHAPATEVASAEACAVSPPVYVPISVPVSRQADSVGNPGPEFPHTVSVHVALTIIITNYCS